MDDERDDDLDLRRLARVVRERDPRIEREARARRARGALTAVLAVVLVVAPWWVATRDTGGDGPPPAGSPAASATPTPTPTLTPTPTPSEVFYTVQGAGKCLRIRVGPGLRFALVDCVADGTILRSDGRTEPADDLVWAYVYSPFAKRWGWAATKYLTAR